MDVRVLEKMRADWEFIAPRMVADGEWTEEQRRAFDREIRDATSKNDQPTAHAWALYLADKAADLLARFGGYDRASRVLARVIRESTGKER